MSETIHTQPGFHAYPTTNTAAPIEVGATVRDWRNDPWTYHGTDGREVFVSRQPVGPIIGLLPVLLDLTINQD